jgi:preprotein translocase SecE subunit
VARNRKRAKERRARRPQAVSARTRDQQDRTGAPNPIEHAAPDSEIAQASELPPGLTEAEVEELELTDAEVEEAEELEEAEPEPVGAGGGGRGTLIGADFDGDSAGEPEAAAPVPEARVRTGNRLLTFLQGSWRELQRVQWPDRRQVMQATGVVIGFVIVAGVFLGAADYVAGKVVSLIVNGHF